MNGEDEKRRFFVKEEFIEWWADAFAQAIKRQTEKIEWLQRREIKLDTAKDAWPIDMIPPEGFESGNYIKVITLDGEATLRLDTLGAHEFDLTKTTEFKQLFHKVLVTNAAQSGKKLILVLGRGDFSFPEAPEKKERRTLVCTNIHLPSAERLLRRQGWGPSLYRSDVFDALNYSRITLLSYSDVASATDGVEIQQSMDGEHWDYSTQYTTLAGVALATSVELVARYVRVLYQNGDATQQEFRLTALARSMP